MAGYDEIEISGTDTAQPINVATRLRLIEQLAPIAGKRVLDGGCGAGGYVTALVARGADAHGVEFDAAKVAEYRRTSNDPDRVRVGDLAAIDAADGSFDVALLNEVLEHVPDERVVLREMHRVLRPGGFLVVFSPNRRYPFEAHGVAWRASGKPIAPAHTLFVPYIPVAIGKQIFAYWARNYWPHELRQLLDDAGFAIEEVAYAWQTFENISGKQPAWMAPLVPWLRRAASMLERTPVLRTFGVSQVILARKT